MAAPTSRTLLGSSGCAGAGYTPGILSIIRPGPIAPFRPEAGLRATQNPPAHSPWRRAGGRVDQCRGARPRRPTGGHVVYGSFRGPRRSAPRAPGGPPPGSTCQVGPRPTDGECCAAAGSTPRSRTCSRDHSHSSPTPRRHGAHHVPRFGSRAGRNLLQLKGRGPSGTFIEGAERTDRQIDDPGAAGEPAQAVAEPVWSRRGEASAWCEALRSPRCRPIRPGVTPHRVRVAMIAGRRV